MMLTLYRQCKPKAVNQKKQRTLHRQLIIDASLTTNYLVLTVSSCLIATFGLISNSTAVIIGAMLIAPLMLPLRSLSLGALEGKWFLFRRALLSIIGGTLIALFLSWLLGSLARIPEFGPEVLSRTQPNLVDLGIAVAAGAISGFAKVRKGISDALAGTAIAVALMPPLCVVGLTLSQGLFSLSWGSFLLYLTNLLGITLACMVTFILAGYTVVNHALGWTIGLTAFMAFPLGSSFLRLVEQAQLQEAIAETLVKETITVGQRVNRTNIRVVWTEKEPLVYILLQTDKEITPTQAKLVQQFITERMGRPFEIIFVVNLVKVVTSADEEPPQHNQPNQEGVSKPKSEKLKTDKLLPPPSPENFLPFPQQPKK